MMMSVNHLTGWAGVPMIYHKMSAMCSFNCTECSHIANNWANLPIAERAEILDADEESSTHASQRLHYISLAAELKTKWDWEFAEAKRLRIPKFRIIIPEIAKSDNGLKQFGFIPVNMSVPEGYKNVEPPIVLHTATDCIEYINKFETSCDAVEFEKSIIFKRLEGGCKKVPLSPILLEFLYGCKVDVHWFNQSVFSKIPVENSMKSEFLADAVRRLVYKHAALRMRFVHDTDRGEWACFQLEADNFVEDDGGVFIHEDLAAFPATEQADEMSRLCEQHQQSLNLDSGPIARVVLFELGHGLAQRLLFIIHHCVVDGISWRILVPDLISHYEDASKESSTGTPIQIRSSRSVGFDEWLRSARLFTLSSDAERALKYWESVADMEPSETLPYDFKNSLKGKNGLIGDASHIEVTFTINETRTLLRDFPDTFKTKINDVLLTALGLAFRTLTGRSGLCVTLEGHGREHINELDILDTVGWFTITFPVFIDVGCDKVGEHERDIFDSLHSVSASLDRVPYNGIDFGLLRYFNSNSEVRRKLQSIAHNDVSFNYLGQFGVSGKDKTISKESGGIRALIEEALVNSTENSGRQMSPRHEATAKWSINGSVAAGQLIMDFAYQPEYFSKESATSVVKSFEIALRTLLKRAN